MSMAIPQKLSQEIESELKAFCQEHALDQQQYQRLCDIVDKGYLLAEHVTQAALKNQFN
ncbi:DUF4344 domain-containing metallopeptidase [Acinetobacter sp. ME22]|uniref:DUF4344 domain-containing metallopeptidase n=1 Tax=Acinetobacter sp. ME22 TaxID=2904802 RepID=UPI001EDC83F8|nr:DUF4344 domain-containing metallopeptidase [Acinetobacter sp. ME22]MCG2572281.1 DUF4344 domain-containing metallopeptidase [Acinetobacter sp. ME22]